MFSHVLQSNTQTSNGSPVVASNLRKRHHSNSERIKRNIKSQLNLVQSDIMSPRMYLPYLFICNVYNTLYNERF